VISESGTHQ